MSEVEKREAMLEVKVVFQSGNHATDESIRKDISMAVFFFGASLHLSEAEVFADINILPSEQPKNGDEPRIRIVCSKCGSEKILFDAYAEWNPELQKMELATTFDKGHYCKQCDGECTTKEIPY